MSEFDGKVALVTGGASGIGRSVAVAYAKEGARVVVSDIDEQGGQETVGLVKEAGTDAVFVPCDVADPRQVEELVRRTSLVVCTTLVTMLGSVVNRTPRWITVSMVGKK